MVAAVGRLGAGDMPVTIDVEAPSPGVSPATYAARIHTWVDRVTAGTGRQPIIYTGRYYWDPFVASSDFRSLPLWHAQYTSASCPNINDRWHDWKFWQYTSSGSVSGIGGRVDRDVFNGSLSDLRSFANSVPDADGDGSPANVDCDDHDAQIHPGAAERCNGRDDNCNGHIDENLVRGCGSDVGVCVAGTESCTGGAWGECAGSVGPSTERCDHQDDDCDGQTDEEQICEREEAAYDAAIIATSADSDVDGDGRADACARTADGFACLASSDHGFGRVMDGPPMTDADGWSEPLRALSLRMGDVDGDGLADLCGRDGDSLTCWRSTGSGFDQVLEGPAFGDDVTNFALADVNGDGREDVCLRDGNGVHCSLSDGHRFARLVELPALGGDDFVNVIHYGTLRFGDVDGDGRDDVCARNAAGVDCWPSEGDHFGERVRGPRWSDAAGFDQLAYWSTVRLADADGDGKADVCARTPNGFRCIRSEGRHFGDELTGPALANGWDDAPVYSTLRMADIDGDGRTDLCAREPDGARCWLFTGHGFDHVLDGPDLGEASAWSDPSHYRSFRVADIDGRRPGGSLRARKRGPALLHLGRRRLRARVDCPLLERRQRPERPGPRRHHPHRRRPGHRAAGRRPPPRRMLRQRREPSPGLAVARAPRPRMAEAKAKDLRLRRRAARRRGTATPLRRALRAGAHPARGCPSTCGGG